MEIQADTGEVKQAIAPFIISASRATDIPAFYGDWFMDRIRKGYVQWKSPFGGNPLYVSFEQARVLVFWSKDPAPFLYHLPELNRLGYRYYFLVTLNDYEKECLEPNVPLLEERIATFARLSGIVGKGRVVWRYDPLLLSDDITPGMLLDRIRRIGDRIHPYTGQMIFSFIEIARYPKVQRNLRKQGFGTVREFTGDEVAEFCTGLSRLNESWGLDLRACAERRDLSRYGIGRGQCINRDLMLREFGDDTAVREFLAGGEGQAVLSGEGQAVNTKRLKDPGQRASCQCIVSKDIGEYTTCPHLCAYCYANASVATVRQKYVTYLKNTSEGKYGDTITG